MPARNAFLVVVVMLGASLPGGAAPVAAGAPPAKELQRQFAATVRPFLESYCLGCHGKDKPKGQLDLSAFADLASVTRALPRWEPVLEMLASREMPPDKAQRQPGDEARRQVVDWIRAVRRREAGRNAGDPGPVLARRLSNAEYDYTIRDLTGVDLRPTREFPVDPANEAGFDNSGESLVMSAALLKKYLDAARTVTDHLVLTPDGFTFAPDPVLTDTDRDRFAVARIVRFYERQPTDLARYFHAAWRFEHRAALGQPRATLATLAVEEKVSAPYLRTVWTALTTAGDSLGPLARLRGMFRALPAAEEGARAGCQAMRDYVVELRPKLSPRFANLQLKAVSAGSQPFILWKDTQWATHRFAFDGQALYVPAPPDPAALRPETIRAEAGLAMAVTHFAFRNIVHDSALPVPYGVFELAATFDPPDPELAIPDEASRPRYQAAFAAFCALFPDAFYIKERGRTHLDQPRDRRDKEAKGRFLAAGFHNMFGYFRDDLPLYQRILDDDGRKELDRLWRELDFITRAAVRQHADFIYSERAEGHALKAAAFDFVRSEDKSATSEAMIRRLAEGYLAQARQSLAQDGGDPRTIPVLEQFFKDVSANIRRVERERVEAEPKQVEALLAFAARAYRRPLTGAERAGLLAFQRSLRADGLDQESAIRDAVARVLMSPHYLYRLEAVPGSGVRPLDDHALASRLSYFLWSSMPDEELLAHAARGDLHRPAVLLAQTRRMLRDAKARALAVEFGGQWLDFRRFEEHNAVDRERFPTFDGKLRQAMFEEPVRFFLDVVTEDRSVLDFLYARDTFVDAALARHYGMPAPRGEGWAHVEDAGRYQRGGILPMAVFLTRNSPGLRTSPVKRGYWVVRRVLGERIPPPPAQVPDLPTDERKMGALTLREVMARHRENRACAGCHARFDPFGLAFEGYGPVGEVRTVDLGGRPVDTRVAFLAGSDEGQGLEGLRDHLRAHRQDDFVDNLCRKLLSYALGRGLILSDETTVETLRARLDARGHRMSTLVESIVTSPQFLTRRAGQPVAERMP
jgi:mono/diheme cytochrome c family protein